MSEKTTQQTLFDRPLTKRERLFVDTYLQTWNASEAARLVGYKGRADVSGARVLAKPWVHALVEQRIKEAAMGADEVLKRLAEQARLNAAAFYTLVARPVLRRGQPVLDVDGNPVTQMEPVINWEMVKRYGYLVKAIERDRNGNLVIRFHDAQNALIHIGKHLKLFSDQVDLNLVNAVKAYIGISPDDWDAEQTPALAPAVEDE